MLETSGCEWKAGFIADAGENDMRRMVIVCATVLTLVLTTGCSTFEHYTMSQTPTGLPCTEIHAQAVGTTTANGCYYYFNNGVATPCDTTHYTKNYCPATKGAYFMYQYKDGKTFRCRIHDDCSSTNNSVITDPTLLCPAQVWSYDTLVDRQLAWQVVDEVHDQNNTPATAQVTFTSTKSSTVTVSSSKDITAFAQLAIPVILASVRTEVNSSVVNSSTAVIGNTYTVSVPPGRTVFGIYGVQVQVTDGHLYATEAYSGDPCTPLSQDLGNVTTTVPIGPGWCVWLDNQSSSLCPIDQ
jgi:hypothetical protein